MFESIFHPTSEPADGFGQDEREALLDLLHYCVHCGQTPPPFATAGGGEAAAAAVRVDWDARVPLARYAMRSAWLAYRAWQEPERRGAFVASIRGRLARPEQRERVMRLCREILDRVNAGAERAAKAM